MQGKQYKNHENTRNTCTYIIATAPHTYIAINIRLSNTITTQRLEREVGK